MNILYLIGNGFDLAQGLKTKYIDFYPTYVGRKEYKSSAIESMCKSIASDYETWADLELALGRYTPNILKGNFDDVYYDLSDCLREYLRNEQSKYIPSNEHIDKLRRDFMLPQNFLLPRDRDSVIELSKIGNMLFHNVNIISFNYTDLIEKVFPEPMVIGDNMGIKTHFRNIFHIHGKLDGTLIMGVNDSSQIHNQAFVNDDDILDVLVKPQSNDVIRSSAPLICDNLIKNADLIILYGLSLGDTDKCWWQKIANTLISNIRSKLVIFVHDNNPVDITRAHKIGSKTKNVISTFLSKTAISEVDIQNIKDRIFVSFDSSFLSTTNM